MINVKKMFQINDGIRQEYDSRNLNIEAFSPLVDMTHHTGKSSHTNRTSPP